MARFASAAMRGPAPAPRHRRKNPCPASPARKRADRVRRSGRGAWRAQIPACVHQTIGMSPRLTGFSPPSGCRQKTQSAQRDPIDSGAAATPSPHHCRLCVCGQCATSSGRFDASGAWRRHRPSFSLCLCQKAQPAQFGGGTNGPITDLPCRADKRSCAQGYLSMPNLDFAAWRNLDPNPVVVFALVALDVINEVAARCALHFRLLQLYALQPRLALGSRTRRQLDAAIGGPRCNARYSLSYSPPRLSALFWPPRPTPRLCLL